MSAEPIPNRPALSFTHETPRDQPAVEALLDRAFGPGRFVKVSERVREIADFAPELSFLAWSEGQLRGVVRQWRVRVGGASVVFLGPLAVDPDQWSAGVGRELVARACAAAKAAGEAAIVLVGDSGYFNRFGFSADLAREIQLPGPVDKRRVLVRAFGPQGEQLRGGAAPLTAG